MEERNIFTRCLDFFKANKWRSAFVGTAVALVGAIIAVIIIAANQTPTPTPTPDDPTASVIPEGAESGVYYYEVAGGEVILSFNSGNKFTIAGPEINKSGDYTVDGNNIVLDFVRDEDPNATATIDGDTVTVKLGDATLPFIKKVNYTVSFDVDGGSSVASVAVLNGKTVSAPAAPTKAGYAFVGWYADGAFKNAFDFNTATISANTTVYARWAEVTVGQKEYSVTLDLGYSVDADNTVIETKGGKLYILDPNPEREGYTFCGWFASMYEDGEKLTAQYSEDMVFDANTTLYAVWADNSSEKLQSPVVTVAANNIKWANVKNAVNYLVKITDASGEVIKEEVVATNNYTYDFSAKEAGDYVVYVTANASDSAKNSDSAVRYYKNKALSRVSKFDIIDNVLVYNSVPGAEKYYISIDCGNDSHNHTNIDNGAYTSYDISNCKMQPGGIKVTVTATAQGYASSVSSPFVYERNLDVITGIVYNAATDTFTWNEVFGTANYEVTVTVGTKTYVINNGTSTSFSAADYTGDIKISVVPKTSGYNSPAAVECTCTKTAPVTPSGLTIVEMLVSWNAVEGATAYQVKIGSQIFTTTETTFNLANQDLGLEIGSVYDVSVKTVKDNESSAFSKAISVGYFVMNPELTYKNNTVYWTPVIGATEYEVRVNGGTAIKVTDANSAKIALTKSGANLIEVRFTDRGGSAWAYTTVNAYEVVYKSLSLDGGDIVEYLALGDTMCPPEAFTNLGYDFNGWYNAPENGKEYEGTVFEGNKNLVLYANWKAQSYNLQLQVDGLGITNIQSGATAGATYNDVYTLPVPVSTDADRGIFVGWYLTPSLSGVRLTDENGKALSVSKFTQDTIVYPVFATGVLKYQLKDDGTYAVTAGSNFDKLANIYIPATYDGKPVTSILENAFESRKRLETIEIPNTIQLVGSGAFTGNVNLKSINVYEVEGNHEVIYSSADGALIRNDMGTVTLEVFPRAKTGTFKTPDGVTTIRNKVFQYSNIDTIIISKDVVSIYERAFYACSRLTTVEFEGGRTSEVTIMCGTAAEPDTIFYHTTGIRTIKLPAMMAEFDLGILDLLPDLAVIDVEEGGINYSSVDGLLANGAGDTILYSPIKLTGNFIVPKGVQHIADSAFVNRLGITSVTIPNYVKSIGNNAFKGCTRISAVTVNGSREYDLTIGASAFQGCNELRTVSLLGSGSTEALDAGRITIGDSAFAPASGYANLTKIIVGNGANVASIGASAFKGQTALTDLVFEDNIVISEIKANAFENDKNLTVLNIPASVTSIGASAFKGCTGLVNLNFTEGTDGNITFGTGAFANCTSLVSVYLPSTVSEFNGTVFNGCSSLSKIEVSEDNPYLESSETGVLYNETYSTLLYYPRGLAVDAATINALPWNTITKIGEVAFADHADLTSFEIKKGVTEIGEGAFQNCDKLTTVTYEALAEGETANANATLVIGKNAFNGCATLTSVSVPDYTTIIGASAFYGAKFASFAMPSALTEIGANAFYGNTALTAIEIPAKVSKIGGGAFQGCTLLSSVSVAGGEDAALITIVNSSSNGVFRGCTSLTGVNFKNRLTNIGDYMFYGSGLKNNLDLLMVPESLGIGTSNITKIGSYAFYNTKVDNITIPATVTSIGISAFATDKTTSTYTLSSITFEEGTATLDFGTNVFKGQKDLKSITFPARTKKLESDEKAGPSGQVNVSNISTFFDGCTSLEKINVTAGGNYYSSQDGVLYKSNSSGRTLLYCPQNNPGTAGYETPTLIVPKDVTLVENRSLVGLTKIEVITFEEYDVNDPNYAKPTLVLGRQGDNLTATVQSYSWAVIGNKYSFNTSTYANTLVTESVVKEINLPSHLKQFGSYSICMTKDVVTLNMNPAANGVRIAKYAFQRAKIVEYNFPGIGELATWALTGLWSTPSSATAQMTTDHNFSYQEGQTLNFTITFGANSTLTTIPNQSFNGVKIKSFVIPASVEKIDGSAFFSAELQTVSAAKGSKLKSIGNTAFGSCKKLKSVDFTNMTQLEQLGNAVFQYNEALVNFTFPESVTMVGFGLFESCPNLETVTLNSSFNADMLYQVQGTDQNTSIFYTTNAWAAKFEKLKAIYVHEDNTNFESVDGVLYDEAMNIVYLYPMARPINGYTIPSTVTQIQHFAFKGYKGSTLEIPDGVTYIGDLAFAYSNITSVTIGNNVNTIGWRAFCNCTALTSVFFEEGNTVLTKISDYAFAAANNVVTISNIPDTVESIGVGTFNNCNKLTEVILPAALTSIPNQLFQNCYKLTNITLQQNITSIGNSAFTCSGITEITIPASVETIGYSAFSMNVNMKDLTVALKKVEFTEGSKLVSIGYQAFQDNIALETINLPESLVEFGVKATANTGIFKGCVNLKSISIPGVETIPDGIFQGCTSLKDVTLSEGTVTIGKKAFYDNTSLSGITIPSTVATIGTSAFENCVNMQTLVFAEGSAMIVLGTDGDAQDNVFKNTPKLGAVELPTSLLEIGGHVFENSGIDAVNLDKLTLLETIGDYAFANCDELERAVVLTNVVTLGDYAFYDCDNIELASVTFGLEYFGELAFGSCEKVTTGYIPSSVLFLNGNPYAGCPAVAAVTIDEDNNYFVVEDGSIYNTDKTTLHYYSNSNTTENVVLLSTVTSIAPGAFAGAQLKSIAIPAKVKTINPFTFFNCANLESVTIAEGITTIDHHAFFGCTSLDDVTVPASATVLGDYAFANCSTLSDFSFASTTATYVIGTHFFENCVSITEVILPAKHQISDEDARPHGNTFIQFNANTGAVTSRKALMNQVIPSYMFAGTGIVNAVIPASVTRIETDGIFMNCALLESVTFSASKLTYNYIGNYMFYNCDSLTELEIPNGDSSGPLNNKIGYTFAECDNLVRVILYYKPQSGMALVQANSRPTSAGMFMNCKSLKEVIIYDVSSPYVEDAPAGGGSEDSGSDSEEGGSGNGGGLDINTPGSGNNSGSGSGTTLPGLGSDSEESGSGSGTTLPGLGSDSEDSGSGSGTTLPGLGSDSEDSGSGSGTTLPGLGSDSEDSGSGNGTTLPGLNISGSNSVSGNNTTTPLGFGAVGNLGSSEESGTTLPGLGSDSEDSGTTLPGLGSDSEDSGSGSGTTLPGLDIGGNNGGSGSGTTIPGLGSDSEDSGSDDSEEGGETTPEEVITYLEYLGSYAFKGCTALKNIKLPGLPNNTGDHVFDGWTSDQTIELSETEEDVEYQVENGLFDGCGANIVYKTSETTED